MRLLEFNGHGGFSLTEFAEDEIPRYSILSHTWGPDCDEVTYKDITTGTGSEKAGFEKLQFCRKRVAEDDLRYFWIDTCCIDRSSSTELSEAINSMFRWYQNAVKCYVFLVDVSTQHSDEGSINNQLCASRWFQRGWTLQELIAPRSVEFFSRQGMSLGNKTSLEAQIHNITGISTLALQGNPLSQFSVSERLSWSRNRDTRRKEDKAYSLLGVFGVHLSPIYGEGELNAFRRLQEEIDKLSRGAPLDTYVMSERTSVPPSVSESKLRDDVLKWISDEDYGQKHNTIRLPRVHGTGRWLLETGEYLTWRDGDYFPNLLWCHGIQGSGKSVLT
jgi:hypothetical protein